MVVGSVAKGICSSVADNPSWRESNTNSDCSAYAKGGQYHGFCTLDSSVDGVTAKEGCPHSCCQIGETKTPDIRVVHKSAPAFAEDAGENTHSLYAAHIIPTHQPTTRPHKPTPEERTSDIGVLLPFTEDAGENRLWKTAPKSTVAPAPYPVLSWIPTCNADYGSKLGDRVCCSSRPERINNIDTICQPAMPFCVGFTGGENFGHCAQACSVLDASCWMQRAAARPKRTPNYSRPPTKWPTKMQPLPIDTPPTRASISAMDKLVSM
jgi:hypothetical protein